MTTTQGTDFIIESVLYSSNKLNKSLKGVELRQITTDIDIYEDLNKPYITANIVILDDSSFISSANIMGGEKITIEIKSVRKNSKLISKTFFINKILNQSRASDNAQVVILHLIEDCVFISNLHNLCRYYSDNPSEIIKKIIIAIFLIGMETVVSSLNFILLVPLEVMSVVTHKKTQILSCYLDVHDW